jgi:hypothetical protein
MQHEIAAAAKRVGDGTSKVVALKSYRSKTYCRTYLFF